jgi:perosamine synthetase
MSDTVPLFKISWGRAEIQNAIDSITRGGYWAKGPYVEEFESLLAEYHGVKHATVFNSGTTALVTALSELGLDSTDEVIIPSFTFIATANAVKIAGGTPVFADIETEYYGLDPEAVREAITGQTVAILPVHYAGAPCRIHELSSIAAEHDLVLIEDAAEAQGAEIDGEQAGTIGDVGVLSFCQNKIITTGEGGAILTDDDTRAREYELLRSHGRASGEYFESAGTGTYEQVGNNFRMADINAAIGTAQLGNIETVIRKRRQVAARYTDAFEEMADVTAPSQPTNGRHVFQLYTVRFAPEVNRDRIIASLEDAGISSKVYFDPVHLATPYSKQKGGERRLETTEAVAQQVLSLPMYPAQESETTERVIHAVRTALGEN